MIDLFLPKLRQHNRRIPNAYIAAALWYIGDDTQIHINCIELSTLQS